MVVSETQCKAKGHFISLPSLYGQLPPPQCGRHIHFNVVRMRKAGLLFLPTGTTSLPLRQVLQVRFPLGITTARCPTISLRCAAGAARRQTTRRRRGTLRAHLLHWRPRLPRPIPYRARGQHSR